jgi:hypothetical protein
LRTASFALPYRASLLLALLDVGFTKRAIVEDDDVLGAWLHDASLAADRWEQHAHPPTYVHSWQEGT